MLRIDYRLEVKRPSNSPNIGFICLAAVVPGSVYDLIRLPGQENHFYLHLPLAYEGKSAISVPSLLPPHHSDNPLWKDSATVRLKASHVVSNSSQKQQRRVGKTILNFAAHEFVSLPMPSEEDLSGHIAASKPMGSWEAHVLETEGAQNADSATQIQVLKRRLGNDGLTTSPVGSTKISIYDFLKAA